MNVTIMGLGHVGCVIAACLARNGHHVYAVDTDARKVGMVEAGQSPTVEPGLAELVASVTASGMLRASTDAAKALSGAHVALICLDRLGSSDQRQERQAIAWAAVEIGRGMGIREDALPVVLRSPVVPGATEHALTPALHAAVDGAASRVRVAVNPEFMREGRSIADFYRPPMILVGTGDPAAAAVVRTLHHGVNAPFVHTSVSVAEAMKLARNRLAA